MRKTFLLAASSFLVLTISCKKTDSNSSTSCKLSRTAIVGLYKITKVTQISIAAEVIKETDVTSDISACSLDDTYQFKSDGNFQWVDAGAHCEGSTLTDSLTYTLSSATLTKDIQDYIPNPWYYAQMDDFTVQQFTCKSMVLEKKVTQITGSVTFQFGVRYYMTRQ